MTDDITGARNDWQVPREALGGAAVVVRCQAHPIAILTRQQPPQLILGPMTLATAELVDGQWCAIVDIESVPEVEGDMIQMGTLHGRLVLGTDLSIPCARRHRAQAHGQGHALSSTVMSGAHERHRASGKPEMLDL